MSTAEEKIKAAAGRNAEIIQLISEVDYAPSAMKQHNAYMQDLQQDIAKSAKKIAVLKTKTKMELKDHEKYRDSFFRRHAHKISGKKEAFAEKAGKEEREYYDAVLAQKNAEDNHAMLERNLKEAMETHASLESAVKRHSDLQRQLDELYNSIFQGQTPEFPEEDTVENEVNNASSEYDSVQYALRVEQQAVAILRNAETAMRSAISNMSSALSASTWDVWGGGSFADYAERDALARAQSKISNVRTLVSQAQRIQPRIKDIGLQDLDQGHFWSDIVFDNIFTDLAMHERIQQGANALHRSTCALANQTHEAEARATKIREDVVKAEARLQQMRTNLQIVRRNAFDKVLTGKTDEIDGPPPSYTDSR